MLRSLKDIMGYAIHAKDGDIGKVHDFFFDDASWAARYVVADTGTWLPGRKVLISPESVEAADGEDGRLEVKLTKKQIEDSPPVGQDIPVSRQEEIHLAEYFGWRPYWPDASVSTPRTGAAGPDAGMPAQAGSASKAEAPVALENPPRDPHLRSVRETTGYGISAKDGSIGHVMDFVLDDTTWALRYLVVDTRNWFPGGRKVLVAPQWIDEIDWSESKVGVSMSVEQVKSSPEFNPDAPVNREYETRLYDYYGRPHYWQR